MKLRYTRKGLDNAALPSPDFAKGGQPLNVGVAIRRERLRRAVLAPAGLRRLVEGLTEVRNRYLRA